MQTILNENKKHIFTALGLLGFIGLRFWFNGPRNRITKNLKSKVIIVTGASEGIGTETAMKLLKDEAVVIFACRDEKKTLDLISKIKNEEMRNRAIFMKIDLSDFESIKNFLSEFKSKFSSLDILINNAGAIFKNFQKSPSGIESTLQVNTLGPIVLTQGLLDLLDKSNGRVINVSSMIYQSFRHDQKFYQAIDTEKYDFNNNSNKDAYSSMNQYEFSKMGNIFFTQYLNEYILDKRLNIKTASLHPGVILTDLFRDYKGFLLNTLIIPIYPIVWLMTKTKVMGAQTTLHLCYVPDKDFVSGAYYADCSPTTLMSHARNKNTCEAFISLAKRFIDVYGKKNDVKFEL